MRDRERDMADEMRLHLEHRIEQKVTAGLTPRAAREEALREFGNVDAWKLYAREQRRTWRIATALRDLAFGWRVLRRNPGFALTAIVTLALGVGANIAVFSVVRAALIEEPAYPDADRVVSISLRVERMRPQEVSVDDVAAIAAGAPSLRLVSARVPTWTSTIKGSADPERSPVSRVLPGYFAVYGVAPALGRTFGPDDYSSADHPAVISDALWRRQFAGRSDVVGQRLRIDSGTFTVVGVMPRDFVDDPSIGVDTGAWTPAVAPSPLQAVRAVGRLRDDADIALATAQIEAVMRPRAKDVEMFDGEVHRYLGVAVDRIGAPEARALQPGVLMLQGIALFLMLITCANLGNVFLAHSAARQREFGVRMSLGAGRARVVGQLMTEAALIAGAGAALAVAIAMTAVPVLVAAAGSIIPRSATVTVSASEIAVALGLAWGTSLIFAGIPAWLTSRTDPREAMRGTRSTTPPGARVFRGFLVTSQVALALVVLTGAGLLARSFVQVLNEPLGFDPRGVVTGEISLPTTSPTWQEESRSFVSRLETELTTALGAHAFVLSGDLPYNDISSSTDYRFVPSSGGPPSKVDMADSRIVTPRVFEFIGIPLQRGRPLTDQDILVSPPVAVVNQAFVQRFAPGQDVVGSRVVAAFGPRNFLIVGVVSDTHDQGLALSPRPAIYVPLAQRPINRLTIAIRGVRNDAAETAMRTAVRAVNGEQPITNVGAIERKIADRERRRRFYLAMLSIFALLAGTLAAVGIYAVVAHSTKQRGREMGIRLALGARPHGLVQMIVRQSLTPVGLGLGIGLVAAWWTARLMQSNPVFAAQLFQTSAHDPATFVAVPAVLLAIALVACWIPARRAGTARVVDVLRAE